jgi:hypothetical protein
MNAQAQSPETLIKNFFTGFEKHDWNMVASQMADDFNFTSPAGDDHIDITRYKEKCWPTNTWFKKILYQKIMTEGNNAFVMYDINTTDNKLVHNVEYWVCQNGKVKSIECFFGTGEHYPGRTKDEK